MATSKKLLWSSPAHGTMRYTLCTVPPGHHPPTQKQDAAVQPPSRERDVRAMACVYRVNIRDENRALDVEQATNMRYNYTGAIYYTHANIDDEQQFNVCLSKGC